MRALRSVTLAPIGMPSRTLKVAIDFRACVMTGFCPAIMREIVGRELHLLGVGGRLADAHVEHDLVDARHAVRGSCSRTARSASAPRRRDNISAAAARSPAPLFGRAASAAGSFGGLRLLARLGFLSFSH